MKKNGVVAVSLIFMFTLSALVLVPGPALRAADKPLELKVSHFWPETSAMHKHMLRWKEKLEADSKGRLTLRIFSSGVILKQTQEWDGLQKGVTDIVYGIRMGSAGREFTEKMPVFTAGADSATMGAKISYDVYNEFPEFRAEFKPVKLLWLAAAGPNEIHTTKPVRKLEDLKGMQLRTAPSGSSIDIMKALQAAPAAMPMSETFMAIQKGTVDGALGPYDILKDFRIADICKYTTNAHLFVLTGHYVAMNINAYNRLPADLRKVLEDSVEWARKDSCKTYDSEDDASEEYAKSKGHEFIKLSPAEHARWIAAIKPVQDKIAADLDAKGYPGTKLKDFIAQRVKFYTSGK
jgi:TRAP-type C4-dicarboxylate transport system substrate-binding protein